MSLIEIRRLGPADAASYRELRLAALKTTPEAFGRMVIEEVYVRKPDACVLESACRRIRREKDFTPSIAEVLKAIDSERRPGEYRALLPHDTPGRFELKLDRFALKLGPSDSAS